MTYEYLKNLKKYDKTIKLLNSDNFAMMVSFFYFVFQTKGYMNINHTQILTILDDFLYDLNQSYNNIYPKSPKEYLDDFVSDKNGYLRKYQGSDDEPLYELTPYTQKVFEFLEGMEKREFVGSRTKFNIIFELLEELEFETNLSDKERIKYLQNQKDEINKKIDAIKSRKDLRFDSSRIKEHFMLIEEHSRKLKYDFSQIEYNFRDLNQEAMEQIATTHESKDSVLSSIFDIEESIRQSDQGKSFFAFWQILTDADKNEKLSTMLKKLYEIDEIKEFDKNKKLKNLKYDLLVNAQKITKIFSKLIEQLRRFLDDRVWAEHKKILEFCKSIEKTAIEIKTNPPTNRDFNTLQNAKISINSVFEKPLFEIKQNREFKNELKQSETEIDIESFYDLFFIDEERLKKNINYFLQINSQCTIYEICKKFPIKKGISELVSYLSIAKNSKNSSVLYDQREKIEIQDTKGEKKIVSIPKIIITRGNI